MSSRPTPERRTDGAVTTRPITASARRSPGANSRAQATTLVTVDGAEVRRARVEPVGVEVRALLLDDEHRLSQRQQAIELVAAERVKLS